MLNILNSDMKDGCTFALFFSPIKEKNKTTIELQELLEKVEVISKIRNEDQSALTNIQN